jgi:flagellar motility protein MotE (MotC chaperone)
MILWRLRTRPSTALVAVPSAEALPAGAAANALPAGDDEWRQRAILAEGKAERAQAAIRSGVLGWMREKIVRTLFSQRAELLSAQQRAELEIRELEQRLEQLHAPLQERISAYEKRIEELEKDLAVKGEENRELIGARINVAKQHLRVERERSRFGTN